jgi:hypothetical protein
VNSKVMMMGGIRAQSGESTRVPDDISVIERTNGVYIRGGGNMSVDETRALADELLRLAARVEARQAEPPVDK